MSLALGIALYLMIWWITLFAVLPFGVKTQKEHGEVTMGTPQSAPARPRMIKTFMINTVVATIVFAVVWIILQNDLLGFATIGPGPAGVTE